MSSLNRTPRGTEGIKMRREIAAINSGTGGKFGNIVQYSEMEKGQEGETTKEGTRTGSKIYRKKEGCTPHPHPLHLPPTQK